MEVPSTRRGFLADIGRGMLVASVGAATAVDLGLTPAWADDEANDGAGRLTFGELEPLVALLEETPIARLVPTLVERFESGTGLKQLVAAAALANARNFGGEDYVGFHTMMALAPAYHMAQELTGPRRALPVLKVLYRNTARIQEHGGRKSEVLRPVSPGELPAGVGPAVAVREAVRGKDMDRAERLFAAVAAQSADQAFEVALTAVEDNTEVHRVVLPYRARDLLEVIGREHAHTLLRQSVRYCVKSERDWKHSAATDEPRRLLPRLFDAYHLPALTPGRRRADDAWVEALSQTIFGSSPTAAAEAVASALAEGTDPADIGEAISLAANQLVLRDAGRPAAQASPGKPPGSVHGDSIGVHACDSANAWRAMGRVAGPRNAAACLVLGGYQVALDRVDRGGDFLHWTPRPEPEQLEAVKATDPEALLTEARAAVRANDQARAAAVVHRYGALGHPARPVFDLLLGFAVSEDGALHAEKYYRTVAEEFAATRPAFRWRQLVALARVTASEFGRAAPGYEDARARLKV